MEVKEETTPWDATSLRPVYLALLAFALLLGVAPFFFAAPADAAPVEGSGSFLGALGGAGALIFGFALLFQHFFYRRPLRRGDFAPHSEEYHRRLFVAALLTWGCGQALILKGFVAYMVAYDLTLHLPFALLGVGVFLLFPPGRMAQETP